MLLGLSDGLSGSYAPWGRVLFAAPKNQQEQLSKCRFLGLSLKPAQRMGGLLWPRTGQGPVRASLMLAPGQSQANLQGNRLRPDAEMAALYGCRRGKLQATEGYL